MSQITIQSIDLIQEQISILFEQDWFQEDIAGLRQILLNKIPDHHVQEVTLGADRETVRFQWLNDGFALDFDYYSQSCWFSAQDEMSASKIQVLFNKLIQE